MKIRKILTECMVLMLVLGSMAIVTGITMENDIYSLTAPMNDLLGEGTLENPFMIHDVDELQAMNDDLTAHYALADDIYASETSGWNGGNGFVPVGTWADRFTGSLDGNNYTITGLYI